MITEYEINNELNPDIWNGDVLKENLRDGFLKIATSFYDFLNINAEMLDVILIGSNANYNWTEHSDIDLHVIINFFDIGTNLHLVKEYLQAKKSIWNTNYPLKYKGMNIELYAQDLNENLHSSVGIYSIAHDKWIQKPSYQMISIDDDIIKQKADPYAYEIDALSIKDDNLDIKIKNILRRLKNLRQSGLDANGEYSVENLAYKYLRNKGYLERLKDMLRATTMGQLDIEDPAVQSLTNHITQKEILDESGWAHIMQRMNAVEDPMGQWKHPGRCTMIPHNQITMKNVPYKVLGIDDTGHMQMMHPEKQYTYPGGKVYEIPMTAQYRTWAIQLLNAIKNGSKYAK
jgi:hypothetical protein